MPMRPVTVRVSAVGNSDWIPLNWFTSGFTVGLGVKLSSGASLTYTVQYTMDDIRAVSSCPLARSTTSLTVTKANHGLSVADWAMLQGTSTGLWQAQYAVASITDANNFVITVANSGATAGVGNVLTARVFPHATLAALTASASGNFIAPPRAVRLNCSVYGSGFADLTVISGGK